MAEEILQYVRKLSGEEALERYIMILAESLSLFPKPGVPFKLHLEDGEIETQIRAVDCWCRGPRKPHVHYRIDLSHHVNLYRPHFGQTVTIVKKENGVYELR